MMRNYIHFTAITIYLVLLPVLAVETVKPPTDSFSLQQQRRFDDASERTVSTYEAPLVGCNTPLRVPHEYIVFLRFGYTLDQYELTVGNDAHLDSAVEIIFPETHLHGTYYAATLCDDSLTAIRKDDGVEKVECSFRPTVIEAMEMGREL